ncbi:phage tail tape measure protein [Pseudomonas sp. R5(2019)]|uniref:phage tail tape measure protein n=1 Tax=Pseudomonas sp. R5(2019) TaxID=2697566 RepID=UPI00141355A1|nr:phage tail tape measure protein [Pseudomonas sp. R5(2019)]NBA97972.1 phage tail tape measure protein [Pseudomonas sp. R5(2019)]
MADRSSRLDFILALTDKVTAPLARVKMSFSELAEQSEENIKQMGVGLAGVWGAATGITESLAPALEMNRALGEVRSLGVAEDALTSLQEKSLQFSVDYGENAQAFVASAYKIDGAIKGLAGNQLAVFTNTSNLLAKATKSDADTMSDYVGTLYNLQKTQADAMGKNTWVEKLGGQTALAVQLFRTDGAQLKDAFKEVGAIATTAGVDLAEQMAVIGSLSSTMEGGDAGGRYKAFFENIGAASEKLGMKFTDQQGKVLPMLDILAKLEGKYGDLTSASAGAKLMEAFGGEGAQVIGALAKDTDRLRNGIDQLGKVRGLENAERMAKAMVDPWQQFGAAVQALRIVFGQALIPMLAPLMERLTGIAGTLLRWTQLFPNITRVVGITVLTVLGLIAGMALLTFTVGASKMVWLSMLTIWKVLTWTGFKSIAMFLYHVVMITAFTVGLIAMVAWMGLVRGAMLLWQAAIWLTNGALMANPVLLIVLGVVALVAAVAAAIYYWDDWTTALMNTAAFQWVVDQLQAVSDWFGSMGGWAGMAKAAWDGIASIFQSAINGLIEMLNKIPGVNINARLGSLADSLPDGGDRAMAAKESMNSSVGSLSPNRPTAVPQGGLLKTIQNTTQTQNKGTHVEKVEIHTAKPMTPLELENMISMGVAG